MQFGKLVNSDAALIGLSNVHSPFVLSDLIHTVNFLWVLKEWGSKALTDQVLVGCEPCFIVPHEVFDHLAIERVFFELVGVAELLQGRVVIAIASCAADLFRKLLERPSILVLEDGMNGDNL